MHRPATSALVLTLALALPAAQPAVAADVLVFAAASMKTALDQVAAGFEDATGDTVTISYAGSNALARQILEGAPADIFISASVQWMDAVENSGEVVEGQRLDLLGNTLVLVAHGEAAPVALNADTDLPALLDGGRLAMAMVDSVPAGQYGKAALESLGLWQAVEPLVAQTDNVRSALALVSTGEAPYGIVYATDAASDPGVTVVGTFPADSHPAIIYPAALLRNAADQADTAFFEALRAPEAQAAFTAQGFTILSE